MNLSKLNFMLSNANAVLGSAVGAAEDRAKGADTGTTIMNFGMNVANGAVRNQVAYDMRRYTGSNLGFAINGMAGYGNPEANARGTMGLMGASIMTSMMGPWGFGGGCNPWMGGMGGFGGGMWGGGPYYGGMMGGGCFGGSMFGGGFGGGFSGSCCDSGMRGGGFYSSMNTSFFPSANARYFFAGGGRGHHC